MKSTLKSAFESIKSSSLKEKFVNVIEWFDQTGLTPEGFCKQWLAQLVALIPICFILVILPGAVNPVVWLLLAIGAGLSAFQQRENSVNVLKKAIQLQTIGGLAGLLAGFGTIMLCIVLGMHAIIALVLGVIVATLLQNHIYNNICPRQIEGPEAEARDRQVNEIFQNMQARGQA